MQERSIVVRGPRMSGQQHFAATFDLYIGDGLGGEGVSACLGDLPDAAFGELGVCEKKHAQTLAHAERLEVHYDGELLVGRYVARGLFRAARFVPVRIAYDAHGLQVHVGGVVLTHDLVIGTWAPQPTWRFGIGARTGEDRTDEHRIDNLLLVVGAEVESKSAWLEVASNGQQFTASHVPFVYNTPHAVSSFYPERGPELGSTQVVISGAGFANGSDYKCRFGGSTVNASFDPIDEVIHCASAPHAPHTASLEVSLNAQQYTRNSVGFTYYAGPIVSVVSPDAGPTGGHTLVRLFGVGLDAGRAYRCRFGSTIVPGTIDLSGTNSTLLCSSPAGASGQLLSDGTRNVSLEVAVNSQDYTSDGRIFTYFEPPAVTTLQPSDGMFYGRTFVVVHGSGLHRQWPDLQCRFGNSRSAHFVGNTSSNHYASTPQKWYGDSVVRGTYRDGTVRCVTPPSAQSGAARLLSISFGPQHLANMTSIEGHGATATLRGAAFVQGARQALRLTTAAYGEMGAIGVAAHDGDRPLSRFTVSFSVSMSGGSCGHAGISAHCGAEGMSFVYGTLPETAFGEADVWSGLRVSMLTGVEPRLVVSYRRVLLETVPAEMRTLQGFVPVVVSYGGYGLSVVYNGSALVRNLTIPRWDPQPGWQFGWGARTSASVDEHLLGDIEIRTDALSGAYRAFEDEPVDVELTLNGQQFTGSDVQYTYLAPARVSAFCPTSGPVVGDTSIIV